MEGRKYLLISFILLGARVRGEMCQSSIFIDCSCAAGERGGLHLVCNTLPEPKKEDLTSIRVLNIYITGKKMDLPDSIAYDYNIWPRLKNIESHQKTLLCKSTIRPSTCSVQTINETITKELNSTNGLTEAMEQITLPTSVNIKQEKDDIATTEKITVNKMKEYGLTGAMEQNTLPATVNTIHETGERLDKTTAGNREMLAKTGNKTQKITQVMDKTTPIMNGEMLTDFIDIVTTEIISVNNTICGKHVSKQVSGNIIIFSSVLIISITLNITLGIIMLFMCLNSQKTRYQQTEIHGDEMLETRV